MTEKKEITIRDIVLEYLERNGFDGLCYLYSDGCGCGADDIAPCGQPMDNCTPAYKYKNGNYGTNKGLREAKNNKISIPSLHTKEDMDERLKSTYSQETEG